MPAADDCGSALRVLVGGLGLGYTAAAALASPRVDEVVVVELHLDHANLPFYSSEGLAPVRTHLAPHGVIAVWSSADSDGFRRDLEQSFDEVRVEPVTFRNDLVDETVTDWIFLAR